MSAPPWEAYGLPNPPSGEWAFEVDEAGDWWLLRRGIRRRNPWKPTDPWDALVAFDLMHVLNANGRRAPIEGAFLDAAKKVQIPVDKVQRDLRKQSTHLWWHQLPR